MYMWFRGSQNPEVINTRKVHRKELSENKKKSEQLTDTLIF